MGLTRADAEVALPGETVWTAAREVAGVSSKGRCFKGSNKVDTADAEPSLAAQEIAVLAVVDEGFARAVATDNAA